jgi:ABC-type Fe3+ transport system substrate-binding protein
MNGLLLTILTAAILSVGLVCHDSSAAATTPWESVLAKAREEGKLIVYASETLRRPAKIFEDRFGIKVRFEGGRGADQRSKILTERRAGLYLADVWAGGFGNMEGMDPSKVFDPLEPALLLPDVQDARNWLNGFLWYDPSDRRFLGMTSRLRGGVAGNPQFFKLGEVTSFQDLLKPEYRGKIVSDDPRQSGIGQRLFVYLYLGQEFGFGPGFIRRLIKEQSLIFTRNTWQAADWAAKGTYLWMGPNDRALDDLKLKGIPIEHRCLDDGLWISVGGGGVGLLNKAPNPNAAKVFLNWLLSKEGQTLLAQEDANVSRRLDAPVPIEVNPCFVPKAGKNYFWVDSREALATRRPGGELARFLNTILN